MIVRTVTLGVLTLMNAVAPLLAQHDEPLELTVDRAVVLALQTDSLLAAGESLVAAAVAGNEASRAARLPDLTVEGSYMRIEEQDPVEVDTSMGVITLGEDVTEVTSIALSVQQPIFLGGRLSSDVARTDALRRAETLDQLWRRTITELELQRSYWHLLEAGRRQEAFVERRDQVAVNLETIGRHFDQGLVTRNEVLTVEMRLAEAELDVIEGRNAVALAMADLAVRIGEDPGRTVVPTSSLPERSAAPADLDELVSRGLSDRPDIRALRGRLDAEGHAVAFERSAYYPELFVTGSYTYARPNGALFLPPDSFEDSWLLGVVGRVAIGAIPRVHRRAEQARSRYESQSHSLTAAEDRLRLEIRSAYLDWASSAQEVRLGRTMVLRAEEHVANTAVRVDNGTALNEDLLDAQVDLLEARLALTSAAVGRELAWLNLMYASATEM